MRQRARLKQGKRYPTRYVSNRSSRRTSECFLSSLLCKALIMQTKGKGSKVLVADRKVRSRLLTFSRGDLPQGLRHQARKGRKIFYGSVCFGQKWQATDALHR